MITTLKITLMRGRYYEADWAANIELDDSSTFAEIHDAIQKAVGFDNDHGFSFFFSRSDRSRNGEYIDDDDELIDTRTVKDIFPPPKKQSLFYLFDWGDAWVFRVTKTRKGLQQALPGVAYPRVESESGIKPDQYPSDEDDEDDEEDED